MKLLIIEDEKALLDSMVSYLQGQQYLCETALNFSAAMEKIDLYDYDCILLDLTLPDGNGLKLLEALKADKKKDGVIIISAKDAIDDKITGLNLGADDYLAKPFHLSELSARIAALIRRKYFNGNNLLMLNEIIIDLRTKTVKVNETPLNLTKKEYELLLFLAANKNRVISKNAIMIHLTGDEADWSDNFDIIYTHIKNLKKKLAQADCEEYIKSIYGMGYKFEI